mgnify:CR=1 FL=1
MSAGSGYSPNVRAIAQMVMDENNNENHVMAVNTALTSAHNGKFIVVPDTAVALVTLTLPDPDDVGDGFIATYLNRSANGLRLLTSGGASIFVGAYEAASDWFKTLDVGGCSKFKLVDGAWYGVEAPTGSWVDA